MRTLTISKNSLFLRFFLWVWETNPEKLNICKLFWGTILFPVAFMSSTKKAYRFIPRITFFYMAGAVIFAALDKWAEAIVWFVFAVAFVFFGYAISQSITERRAEKDRALSNLTGRGTVVWEWIEDHTIGWLLDLAYGYHERDSRVGQHIGGFFGVISEYAHSAKQHLCLLVRVK